MGKIPIRHPSEGSVKIEIGKSKFSKDKHIYTLTLPTGAGKTLTSLRVLKLLLDKIGADRRIFYSLPYVSIIEQNAEVWRKVFQGKKRHEPSEEVWWPVAEFHYNAFEVEDIPDESFSSARRFVERTAYVFEHPIIFTSFERMWRMFLRTQRRDAMLSNYLLRSVVIFDEIQGLPAEYWETFANMVRDFADILDIYFIFMTATQIPLFDGDEVVELTEGNWEWKETKGRDSPKVKEQVTVYGDAPNFLDVWERIGYLRRRQYKILRGESQVKEQEQEGEQEQSCFDKHVSEFLLPHVEREVKDGRNIAVILNTINRAKTVFEKLTGGAINLEDYEVYLLTSFVPSDARKKLIECIRELNKKNKKYIVVSTQVIEAGVDLDFDVVFREIAPLDAVIQSGGRCNRKGRSGQQEGEKQGQEYTVYVFWLENNENVDSRHMRSYGPVLNRVSAQMWREIHEWKQEDAISEKELYTWLLGGPLLKRLFGDIEEKDMEEKGFFTRVNDAIWRYRREPYSRFLEGYTRELSKESLIENTIWSDVNSMMRDLYEAVGIGLPDTSSKDKLLAIADLRKAMVSFFMLFYPPKFGIQKRFFDETWQKITGRKWRDWLDYLESLANAQERKTEIEDVTRKMECLAKALKFVEKAKRHDCMSKVLERLEESEELLNDKCKGDEELKHLVKDICPSGDE